MNFTRTWLEYREGFGDVSSEFWLGNEALRLLTKDGSNWTIRVDLTDEEGQKMSLMTSPFSITGDKYALNVGSPGIEPGMESNLLIIPNAERLTFTKYVSRNKNLESTKKEHLFCTSFMFFFL